MIEPLLTRTITLRCPPDHAFRVFTQMTDLWWPRGHRRTAAAKVILEASENGRLVERSPDGSEWMLGRITAYEPPGRLHFEWFPGSPAAPTAVEIIFRATREGSEIAITHHALSAGAQAAWPEKVALFKRGWDTILPALSAFIGGEPEN